MIPRIVDIDRFAVRAQQDTVRLPELSRFDNPYELTVRVEVKDRLPRLRFFESRGELRVGNIDAAFCIDDQVVRAVDRDTVVIAGKPSYDFA